MTSNRDAALFAVIGIFGALAVGYNYGLTSAQKATEIFMVDASHFKLEATCNSPDELITTMNCSIEIERGERPNMLDDNLPSIIFSVPRPERFVSVKCI